LTPAQYAFLAQFLKERSGIAIGEDKRYLVEARLGPLARRLGLATVADLVGRVSAGDLESQRLVIEAMTTNETFFFRDSGPFTAFTDVMLPELLVRRAKERRIRIWSAACSSGQEAYSLAMLLDDWAARLAGWTVDIVATDLSSEVVERARAGLFSQFEVQRGLPIRQLLKHFTQEGDRWRISAALRARVQFRTLNLLRDFSALGRFDIVFCRNVLIYFEEATKADILARIARQMAPDGYLVLGSAESLVGTGAPFGPHAQHRLLNVPAPRLPGALAAAI